MSNKVDKSEEETSRLKVVGFLFSSNMFFVMYMGMIDQYVIRVEGTFAHHGSPLGICLSLELNNCG
jgi:hypothetical protein